MSEPRYVLIDVQTGNKVQITTAELQTLFWRMELQQPLNEAYIEYQQKGNQRRTEHSLPLVQRNNGC